MTDRTDTFSAAEPFPQGQGLGYDDVKRHATATAAAFEVLANAIAARSEFSVIAERARLRIHELRDGKFAIMVVGQFNRGKSTLLNAMLGRRLLSSKLTPCTAVVSYLRYGAKPQVEIFFNDDRKPNPESLSLDEFGKKYTLNIDDARLTGFDAETAAEEARDRFSHVDYSVIYDDAAIFENGVEFIDTPGLEDNNVRTARVLDNLEHADAIIMVLDAVTVCDQRESDFIDTKLRPLGLHRNVFFLINRWNLVIQSVLNPNDPKEVEETLAEQMHFIHTRLAPFVAMAGRDAAGKRIFKVNALGALQQRLAGAKDGAALEATEIPAFEHALREFLTRDRFAARRSKDFAIVSGIEKEVARNIAAAIAKLKEPIRTLDVEHATLSAQLEQLRRIKINIEHLCRAHAAETADQLANSLEKYVNSEVFDKLHLHVQKFDLGKLGKIVTQYKIAFDYVVGKLDGWVKQALYGTKTDAKLEVLDRITDHIQGQVSGMLTKAFTGWSENYLRPHLGERARSLTTKLHYEAAEYVKVLTEIQGHAPVATAVSEEEIQAKIKEWLSAPALGPRDIFSGPALDATPLLVSIIATEIAHHVTVQLIAPGLLLPGIGLMVSAAVIVLRKGFLQDKVRAELEQGLKNNQRAIILDLKARARESVEAAFDKISKPISVSIESEIAVLARNMTDILEKRHQAGFSAEAEEKALRAYETGVMRASRNIRALVE